MGEAVGLSHLYPIVPIMNFFSMVLLLLIVPRFWKTRIVALVSVVCWIFIGNLTSFLGMVQWRGHTNDALVWASILAALSRTWYCGFFTSAACFAHFTWQRLQPLSARQLYDTRRRDNLIHLFLTLILPVLWAPLFLLSTDFRYMLIEDFGPIMSVRRDWPGFVSLLPVNLSYATVGIFSVLALVRYWHAKQEDVESDALKHHPSVRTRKLLLMAAVNTLLAAYGIYNQFTFWWNFGWWIPRKSMAESISSLQLVFTVTRNDLVASFEFAARGRTITAISVPLLGFYVFAWYGCGEEARKAYRDGFLKFGRLVGVAGALSLSWSAKAIRKVKPHQGLLDHLPLVQPNSPHITPYVSNVVNNKRTPPPKEPARRPSIHKPPFAPLYPANAATNLIPNSSARWLSSHKPPLVPLDPTNTTASPSARRLSHHKPTFSLLDSTNAIPNTTCDPSRSMRQHSDDFNNARRQGKFAPRPLARRLSYHKPSIRPLVLVNPRRVVPDVLGTSILAHARRKPHCSRATGLPAESTVDAPPPAFPTSSAYVASQPLYQPPATPAPPYQYLDPFPGGTP